VHAWAHTHPLFSVLKNAYKFAFSICGLSKHMYCIKSAKENMNTILVKIMNNIYETGNFASGWKISMLHMII
jgi:hypothetical protein